MMKGGKSLKCTINPIDNFQKKVFLILSMIYRSITSNKISWTILIF